MRWPKLRAILERQPLGYKAEKGKATSHRKMTAPGRPTLRMGFHDNEDIGGTMVRRILVDQVGLSEAEARKLVR